MNISSYNNYNFNIKIFFTLINSIFYFFPLILLNNYVSKISDSN